MIKKIDNTKISVREYARRLGVDEKAIRKAIESAKIKKGYDPKLKKIIPAIANKEYGNTVVKKPPKQDPPPKKKPAKRKHKNDHEDRLFAKDNDSYAEALRKDTIIKANTNALKLRMREGELVEKQKVFKELFSFGKQIRIKFQSVPDRIIDDLLAAPGRNEAHTILFNAIADVLDELTGVGESDLKLNQ